jgi:hypothetical protein
MKGDFTRSTFRSEKHYSRVLQQQGRVQLDSDWNEALDILTYREREALVDVIGRCCAPEGSAGFEITAANGDLRIGAGRYYVDGILVENDQDQLFSAQDDLPDAQLPEDPGRYLFYLDVWERHITALEDPEIREVALGGPDTATRTQVLGQVKWLPVDDGASCDNLDRGWEPEASSGTLAARTQPADDQKEPCVIPPGAGYQRLENQLYRVEIYKGGTLGDPQNEPTFTYSREDGSVVAALVEIDANTLTVGAEGRDDNVSFHPTDWVEINDDHRELHGLRGILVQLSDVEGRELTINPGTAIFPEGLNTIPSAVDPLGPKLKVRRWESDGAAPVQSDPAVNDGFTSLESGVEVHFGPGTYQTGDYWLIPARTNIVDVLWPVDSVTGDPIPESPHGIEHHYCVLALATFMPGAAAPIGTWRNISDCRCTFPPLSELPEDVEAGGGLCTVTLGVDGVNDLQEAVDRLPDEGGCICIPAGVFEHQERVFIAGRRAITIKGCGPSSEVVISHDNPFFFIGKSTDITLRNFKAVNESGGLVEIELVERVRILDCTMVGPNLAVHVGGENTDLTIERSIVLAPVGLLLESSEVHGLFVRRNHFQTAEGQAAEFAVGAIDSGSLTNAHIVENTFDGAGLVFDPLPEGADVFVVRNRILPLEAPAVLISAMLFHALLTITENQIGTEDRAFDFLPTIQQGVLVKAMEPESKLLLEENRVMVQGKAVEVIGEKTGYVHVSGNVFRSSGPIPAISIGDIQSGLPVFQTLFSNNQVHADGERPDNQCTVELNASHLVVMGNYVRDREGERQTSICFPGENEAIVTAMGNVTGNGVRHEGIDIPEQFIVVNNARFL